MGEVFVATCKKSGETSSAEYKRLYWFHWKCFQAADADRDGMVSGDEFNKMIDMATAAQKRFGMDVPYKTDDERTAMFKKMDENGDGSISFDEWRFLPHRDHLQGGLDCQLPPDDHLQGGLDCQLQPDDHLQGGIDWQLPPDDHLQGGPDCQLLPDDHH